MAVKIEELSKSLLKRYAKKASGDTHVAVVKVNKRDEYHDNSVISHKANNRLSGIKKAKARIKEEHNPMTEEQDPADHPKVQKTIEAHEHEIFNRGGTPTNFGAHVDFENPKSHSTIYSKVTTQFAKHNSGGLETHHDHNTGKITHKWSLKPVKLRKESDDEGDEGVTENDHELDEGNPVNKKKKNDAIEKIGMEHRKKVGGALHRSPKRIGRAITKEDDDLDEIAKATLNRYRQQAKERFRAKGGINKALEKQDRDDKDSGNPNRKRAVNESDDDFHIVDAVMVDDHIPVNLYIDQMEVRCNRVVDEKKAELKHTVFDFSGGKGPNK